MRLVSWKSGNAFAVCVMAIVIGQLTTSISGSARAIHEQDQAPADQTPAEQAPTPKPAPPQPAPQPPRSPIPLGPNIRVDITITDQAGAEAPVKKTLSVIAADRHQGFIRAKVAVPVPRRDTGIFDFMDLPLNVDVRSEVMENGLIRSKLVLNYETISRTGSQSARSVVTADQTVMLENGKPLTVSQTADAATDRKVMLEVKATILR